MMIPNRPPETYQQWLECFMYLNQNPLDEQVLQMLSLGKFLGQPTQQFLARMSDVVSLCISACCRRFLRQLDLALAEGEPDMAPLLVSRFRRNLQSCFFYRRLTFLDGSYIQTLDQGFGEQLESFWKNFLGELRKSAKDSDSPVMEDLYYEMKRKTILY